MATEPMVFNPFSIRSLLALPILEGKDQSTWCLSAFEKSLTPTTFALDVPQDAELQNLEGDLFSLHLDDVSVPRTESIADLTVASDVGSNGIVPVRAQLAVEEEDNIWTFPDVVHGVHKDGLLSWDNPAGDEHTELKSNYLSEATKGHFGLALCLPKHGDDQVVLRHAKPDVLRASLRQLSLGRDSVFFGYDTLKECFAPRFESYTVQDISQDLLNGLTTSFLQLGNNMRALRSFVKQGTDFQEHVSVGLSSAIGIAIHALESCMRLSGTDAQSFMQLQESIRRPAIITTSLRALVARFPVNGKDITPFFRFSDSLSEKHPWMCEALQEIVARSISSEIEAASQSVGLGTSTIPPQTLLSETSVPVVLTGSLLTAEATGVFVESQQALALLRQDCPHHLLLAHSSASCVKLEWECSWEAISKLQAKASEYETNLKHALLALRITASSSLDAEVAELPVSVGLNEGDLGFTHQHESEHFDFGNFAELQKILDDDVSHCGPDKLFETVSNVLSNNDVQRSDLQPESDQSVTLSLMPLLTAQHRLLSFSILTLLFDVHSLQNHLLIQNRFQLLGDGLFASRLSHALFDSAEASGEGRRRDGGRTGLRLQSRDTWPPASSELRLVLMGILSDSLSTKNWHRNMLGARLKSVRRTAIHQTSTTTRTRASSSAEVTLLLESLSFAIRDLSDEELEKCRDVDSVHALDFLALQYKPPTPLLEAIITPRSLKLYDSIFMLSLRLLRVKSAAQELVRAATSRSKLMYTFLARDHKLRLEIHHFMSNLADWVQNTVIAQKWTSFAATIDRIGNSLERGDYDGVLKVGKGLDHIKSLHEGVVDDISRTLFLRKKHTEVRAVLDQIFNLVLQVAKTVRAGAKPEGDDDYDATIRRFHEGFRQEVKRFLAYLRPNSIEFHEERSLTGPEAQMEQLAMKLDMFGFYAD